jgi:sugar/nucleoside kinase (ribokinase family)
LSEAESAPLWPRRRPATEVDLLGLGQISLDRVVVLPRWPARGEKLALLEEELRPGGQIATALLAARRLGLRSACIGAVGDDDAAPRALAPLRAAGVDVSGVRVFAGVATRQALVLCEAEGGERTVLERRDPALRLSERDVTRERIESAGALLVDAEHPEASLAALRLARRAGLLTLCDVERADAASRAIAREALLPIVSAGFADKTSSGDCAEALRRCAGPDACMAVMTRGERGALALHGGRVLELPALKIEAVDTTGAGDVFRGALAVAALGGRGARESLAFACAAAGLACLGRGAQGALPDLAEVEARLRAGR